MFVGFTNPQLVESGSIKQRAEKRKHHPETQKNFATLKNELRRAIFVADYMARFYFEKRGLGGYWDNYLLNHPTSDGAYIIYNMLSNWLASVESREGVIGFLEAIEAHTQELEKICHGHQYEFNLAQTQDKSKEMQPYIDNLRTKLNEMIDLVGYRKQVEE